MTARSHANFSERRNGEGQPMLSAQRRHRRGDYSLLAIVVYVANEYPTVRAGVGAQALKAGVVRLHSVVVILSRWVRVGCARLLYGHEVPPRGPGSGVFLAPAGPFPSLWHTQYLTLAIILQVLYTIFTRKRS